MIWNFSHVVVIVMETKTELEWIYSPIDFFPSDTRNTASGTLRFADGRVTLGLATPPANPSAPELIQQANQIVQDLFLVQSVATHRNYTINEQPKVICTSADSSKVVFLSVTDTLTITTYPLDVIVKGPNGVIRDTKAERLARQAKLLAEVEPKLAQSPVLRSLCHSYSQAITDPADEFVHLYEIRDRLKTHYGGKAKAIRTLNCEAAWKALDKLTNFAPVTKSRHRGLHGTALRHATKEELDEARRAAHELILAFARTV